jgi:uncharacterized protein (DUF427 family)
VGIDEVNATAAWLADFTRERALPQKLFVVHEFAPRMIVERERLDLSRDTCRLRGRAHGYWYVIRSGTGCTAIVWTGSSIGVSSS